MQSEILRSLSFDPEALDGLRGVFNVDGKIGLAEAIYLIQEVTGTVPVVARFPDVVISEIMYHLESADAEYIELYNITGSPVILQEYDADKDETIPWRFTAGIEYAFPLGITIPAHGHLLVVQDRALCGSIHYTGGCGRVWSLCWEAKQRRRETGDFDARRRG